MSEVGASGGEAKCDEQNVCIAPVNFMPFYRSGRVARGEGRDPHVPSLWRHWHKGALCHGGQEAYTLVLQYTPLLIV